MSAGSASSNGSACARSMTSRKGWNKMTTNKPQFVYVTYISTTPEKVWNALMDGEMTKQYWGLHRNVSDWKVGSAWSHQDHETGAVHVTGEVLESDPPRRLVLSWGHPDEESKKK